MKKPEPPLQPAEELIPSEAYTIAKFAYNAYQFMNSNEDNGDYKIILNLLLQIDTKLDIISNKLDSIYSELKKLSDIILYKSHISKLNAILKEFKTTFRTLDNFIFKYGKDEGIKKYFEENLVTVQANLNFLRLACQDLISSYDPLTTTLMASAMKIDFQLSVILNLNPITITEKLTDYKVYFDNNNLVSQIYQERTETEIWRMYESLLNRCTNKDECSVNVAGVGPVTKLPDLYFYELRPSPITESEMEPDAWVLIQFFLRNGFLKEQELNIKMNYTRERVGPKEGYIETHLNRPRIKQLIKNGYIRPGKEGLISHGFSEHPNHNTFQITYAKKKDIVDHELKTRFAKLMSYLSALNTKNAAQTFLNEMISKYSTLEPN